MDLNPELFEIMGYEDMDDDDDEAIPVDETYIGKLIEETRIPLGMNEREFEEGEKHQKLKEVSPEAGKLGGKRRISRKKGRVARSARRRRRIVTSRKRIKV